MNPIPCFLHFLIKTKILKFKILRRVHGKFAAIQQNHQNSMLFHETIPLNKFSCLSCLSLVVSCLVVPAGLSTWVSILKELFKVRYNLIYLVITNCLVITSAACSYRYLVITTNISPMYDEEFRLWKLFYLVEFSPPKSWGNRQPKHLATGGCHKKDYRNYFVIVFVRVLKTTVGRISPK
jgi:hypothetical protein